MAAGDVGRLGKNPKTGQFLAVTLLQAQKRTVSDFRALVDAKGNGVADVSQYFQFVDQRTDGTKILLAPNSGFKLSYVAENVGGTYYVKVTRTGKANNGTEAGIVTGDDAKQIVDPVQVP